jgi:hypothetical protein
MDLLQIPNPAAVDLAVSVVEFPLLRIVAEGISLLCRFAAIAIGQRMVLRGLETLAASHKNDPQDRFEPLLQLLRRDSRSISGENSIESLEEKVVLGPLKGGVVVLINLLINNTEDLQDRYLLRSELIELGYMDLLNVNIFFDRKMI